VLRVLSEPTQDKFQDTVFGFAVVPILASVYYDHALRTVKKDNAEFEVPIILGSVIAHEVGHLLLGLNSHTSAGVMQPRWERKQVRRAMTGALLFTHEQSKLVQAERKDEEFRGGQRQPAALGKSRSTGQNCGVIPQNDWSRSGVASRFRLSSVLQRSLGRQPMLCGVRLGMENCAFQIRSSSRHFCRFLRFARLEKSISCVFSMPLNIPTPPASTLITTLLSMDYGAYMCARVPPVFRFRS
jgi:hypothetical protein